MVMELFTGHHRNTAVPLLKISIHFRKVQRASCGGELGRWVSGKQSTCRVRKTMEYESPAPTKKWSMTVVTLVLMGRVKQSPRALGQDGELPAQ